MDPEEIFILTLRQGRCCFCNGPSVTVGHFYHHVADISDKVRKLDPGLRARLVRIELEFDLTSALHELRDEIRQFRQGYSPYAIALDVAGRVLGELDDAIEDAIRKELEGRVIVGRGRSKKDKGGSRLRRRLK